MSVYSGAQQPQSTEGNKCAGRSAAASARKRRNRNSRWVCLKNSCLVRVHRPLNVNLFLLVCLLCPRQHTRQVLLALYTTLFMLLSCTKHIWYSEHGPYHQLEIILE